MLLGLLRTGIIIITVVTPLLKNMSFSTRRGSVVDHRKVTASPDQR
jgi:hypothetical protein